MGDQPPFVVDRDNDQPTDHGPATDQQPADQAPLSLEDAAERLGITVNAVRQRLKRGTVHGKKTAAGWVVFLSTDQATRDDAGRRPTDQPSGMTRPATNRPGDQAAIAPLADLLADVTRRNEELAAAAALWQYRAMQAEERLAQLEAGPVAGDVGDAAVNEMQAPTSRAVAAEAPDTRQSAWRRWWRKMTGAAVDLS
jgi:hypothetical protein